ncbi:hypothetical protein Ctob_013409 [Chrysochromulina tobinii]|uniref:Endonuclease/exonuclease/phosphatase domain-containing protein n=1 Tax=Chrysochromulina tobinii TaxID=1460289 RepID=A0A0M0K1H2_9EUKA|nr:hypothetical protein Ctob_013409 [Chrysochromulina tobinii]|eukprot:KOO32654.1 hypothetical protein Ctob_013409 [Chrysochromulina sp. CCMP291]
MHLKPYDRLPQLGPSGLTLLTWNVLIPNSNDGWWIYKMYEPTGSAGGPAADVHTTWAHRQGLMRDRLLEAAPDIICLQETSHVTDQAFANDWAFLREAGYECAVLSRGRMRPATFWKSSKLRLCCADGSLPSAPSALTGTPEHGGKAEPATSAEPAADKAETAGKVEGQVLPAFRESGDPTEPRASEIEVTAKPKAQTLARFADAAEEAYGGAGEPVPPTIVAKELAWLTTINGVPTRGSESRSAAAAREAHGGTALTRADFQKVYAEELAQGKFWGVEHDVRAVLGQGLAPPAGGGTPPFTARFDYVYYSTSALRLVGVQRPLETARMAELLDGRAILPNAWFPSDHLPVAAAFELTGQLTSAAEAVQELS